MKFNRLVSITILKKTFVFASISIFILLIVRCMQCGLSGIKMVRGVINGKEIEFAENYPTVRSCTNGLPFINKLDKIFNGTYLVLLQNNTELRATGGFPGSYARVTFKKGVLYSKEVEDLYQPDGQLKGHVEPPYPIQEAFMQGWYKLRDANWDPDYPTAATVMDWFFEKGGENKVDGIVAVNLGFLTKWLDIIGPIKVMPFDTIVDSKNLYTLAQSYSQTRISENATLKKEFIGSTGEALWEKTKSAGWVKLLKLAVLTIDQLEKKQILVWVKDQDIEKDVVNSQWDGGLTSGWNGNGGYLYVVDSNLGSNKADCCISRQVKLSIRKVGNHSDETIYMNWQNNGTLPIIWGGVYNDYVRVVLPKTGVSELKVKVGDKILRKATAEDFSIPNSLRKSRSMDMYMVEERDYQTQTGTESLQTIGFWLPTIGLGEKQNAEIKLTSERNPFRGFSIFVKRQPGVYSLDFQAVGNGNTLVNEKISEDKNYQWGL